MELLYTLNYVKPYPFNHSKHDYLRIVSILLELIDLRGPRTQTTESKDISHRVILALATDHRVGGGGRQYLELAEII